MSRISSIAERMPVIIDSSTPPLCSSCGKVIEPYSRAVRFTCPNCGKTAIWRCEKCRKLGALYRCPSCGFEGP